MRYPYMLYDEKVAVQPLVSGLHGAPYILDLSPAGDILADLQARDQQGLQRVLEQKMRGRYSWGLSPYLEERSTLLSDCPQMVEEGRFFHLGLDIILPLRTKLHAPLDARVEVSGVEEGEGNYGGFVLLRHESPLFETFFSLYGHLHHASLPQKGESVSAGEAFAEIGDFHENGNWFYHTHLQVITQKGYDAGYLSKGYCAASDLATIHHVVPSPLMLFILKSRQDG
ncbi:peptidoglycan DD-metalloendopeptidase family protein [Sediminispirochaeta smaragdinae]|uniref:peptidoglycan DD-metalloendopeptidase family protein n=1 Tax=Sediminispirochaeta smaragdinae TaxID=55206 RepID=UPI0003038BB4|nr:peptidoglycan DD-metalloendopeptidase family protein [Sediminispirochaeta smaragdinae]